MSKGVPRLSRLGVLAPAALSACIDASVLAAPAAGAIVSTVLKELSKAFMLKKWFHGVMSSQEAEQLLLQKGKHGSYMVRESRAHPGKYVLSVRVRTRVSHVMIRKEQNKYDVGCGEIFDDLTGLIEHCRAYPLTEASGEMLRLRQPVCGARARSKHLTEEPTDKPPAGRPAIAVPLEPRPALPERRHPSLMQIEVREEAPFSCPSADHADREMEYRRIKNEPRIRHFTTVEGWLHVNIDKNRYTDVVPYDQTRVPLPRAYSLELECTDYINASYIRPVWMFEMMIPYLDANPRTTFHSADWKDIHSIESARAGPDKPWWLYSSEERCAHYTKVGVVNDKFYIATQGPLDITTDDFWAMVADNDVRVICMMAECTENRKDKCEKYWPDFGCALEFRLHKVTNVAEYFHPDYVAREFTLSSALDKPIKKVYHYQFKSWVDHRVPTDLRSVLRFVGVVNDRMKAVASEPTAPKHNIMCVHCSAGIGRTGAFIALDMLIDMAKINNELEDEVDIPRIVSSIRKQRAGMVQNLCQYKFLYDSAAQYMHNKTLYRI